MDRYFAKATIMKLPRLPSDADDDHDGRSGIEGWATEAGVQGTKAGGTKMMGKEKRLPGVHKTTVLPRAREIRESTDTAPMTGLVMVSIKKLIFLIVYDID
jgi:hypothetical protein